MPWPLRVFQLPGQFLKIPTPELSQSQFIEEDEHIADTVIVFADFCVGEWTSGSALPCGGRTRHLGVGICRSFMSMACKRRWTLSICLVTRRLCCLAPYRRNTELRGVLGDSSARKPKCPGLINNHGAPRPTVPSD